MSGWLCEHGYDRDVCPTCNPLPMWQVAIMVVIVTMIGFWLAVGHS